MICPHCKENCSFGATKCPHCHSDIPESEGWQQVLSTIAGIGVIILLIIIFS